MPGRWLMFTAEVVGGVRVGRDAGLALGAGLARALDAAALETLVDAEDDVVRDEGLEVEHLLHTEAAESSADNVRGKTEEALGNLLHAGVLAVEACSRVRVGWQ